MYQLTPRVPWVVLLAGLLAPAPSVVTAQTGSAIGDAAYPLLAERVTANQMNFFVYRDADSGFNHGFPSGFFPDPVGVEKISLDSACVDDLDSADGCSTDPQALDFERGNVLRISFAPLLPGEFAGLHIEEPEGFSGGATGTGYDVTGSTRVLFEVRSPTGLSLQFGVGDIPTEFITLPPSADYSTLCIALVAPASLTCPADVDLKLDLMSPPDLTDLHFLFSVITNDQNAAEGGVVLLDRIRYEPVPVRQQTDEKALSLPLSTETFGVIPLQAPAPGRVKYPPDQVNRNVTTIYESALTAAALLDRGTPGDVGSARTIADTLDYALIHDNRGDPLPPECLDGQLSSPQCGLHNAYESGERSLQFLPQHPAPHQF